MPETNDKLQQTIGEMLAQFDGGPQPAAEPEPPVETPEPAAEAVETPVVEVEEFNPNEFTLEADIPVVAPVEPVAEATAEEEPDLLAIVKQQHDMLVKQQEWIASMQLQQRGVTAGPHSQGAEPAVSPTAAPAPAPQAATAPAVQKLEMAQFEQLLNSPELFQQYMLQVQTAAAAQAAEAVMARVGGLVNQTVSHQVSVSAMVSNFFKDNQDLLPYRNQVGIIANELMSENPGISYADLFKRTNEEARKRLQPLLAAARLPRVSRPGFAGRQSTVRTQAAKPVLDPMQAEIEELLSLT